MEVSDLRSSGLTTVACPHEECGGAIDITAQLDAHTGLAAVRCPYCDAAKRV